MVNTETISLYYQLSLTSSGEVVEAIDENRPESFQLNSGQLLPAFEEHIKKLKEGQSFDFILSKEEAYGERDPYAIFDLPKDTFSEDGQIQHELLFIGNEIPMLDNQGNPHTGKIIKIMKDSLTMDFNHPLAGHELRFRGKLVSRQTKKY